MFYGRMRQYSIARPEYTKDNYNHSSVSYHNEGTAKVYIVVEDRTMKNVNDINLYVGTLVGYTLDNNIQKDWLIDNKYIVTSVLPHKTLANVLYLTEFQDGK